MSTPHDSAQADCRQCENTHLAGLDFDKVGRINPLIDTTLSATALNVADALDFVAVASLAHLSEGGSDALTLWLCNLAVALRTAESLERARSGGQADG